MKNLVDQVLPTMKEIQNWPNGKLISCILNGEEINWDILFEGESDKGLVEYIENLYIEKESRGL